MPNVRQTRYTEESKPRQTLGGRVAINIIIIVAVVVAAVLAIRGYVARGGKGDCCGGTDVVRAKGPKDKDASHYAHAYQVKGDGMSCENCAKRIANAFNARPGTMASVDLAAGMATVRTKEPAEADELRRIVRNEGYGTGSVTEL